MNSIEQLFGLEGKTAVITGGTGELCGSIAQAFALAGATVIIAGRSEEKAKQKLDSIKKQGGQGHFVPLDLNSPNCFQNLLSESLKLTPQIHILVNGAGVNSPTPFLEVAEEEIENIFNINYKALFKTCQVFGKYFLENKIPASIINIGSMSGLIPLSKVFNYSASKAAVHNLSKNLAREWAVHNIRVNTLVPGFFPAEQNKKVLNPARIESIMGHTPMKRFGSAEELWGAALLLASQKAGGFITGLELVVDGGFSSTTI